MVAGSVRSQQSEAEVFTAHPELRGELEKIAVTQSRAKSVVLFKQGETPRGVFLLQKGRVRLTLRADDGQKLSYRVVGPGYILGLPGTLCDRAYSLTAETLEASKLAFVRRKDFVALLRERNDLCLEAVRILGWEVRELRHKQAQAAANRVRKSP